MSTQSPFPTSFGGLDTWARRHYTQGDLRIVDSRLIHRYERYQLRGSAAPSERDFLDLGRPFRGGGPKPPLVRLLRKEGLLDRYLLAAMALYEKDLLEAVRSQNGMGQSVKNYVG